MNKYFTYLAGFFRLGGNSLSTASGLQNSAPMVVMLDDTPTATIDTALQISAVWRSVEVLSKLIATLPMIVYANVNGKREIARDTGLWSLLHESPNSRMTTVEFWTCLLLNLLFKGNAYARIQRNPITGEAEALWPMPSDQVELRIMPDGTEVYLYRVDNDVAVLSAENVLHIKEMGNGVIGWSRLDYMRVTLGEARSAQSAASKLFATGGKPTGILMVDNVLNPDQRKVVKEGFAEMATGSMQRLFVLEANMKYQQINLSPEDMQLLSTRQFTIQEIGRWFGVPSILLNQTEGTTTLGSSSADIIDSFHKLTIRPMIVNIEQAIKKRVMTAGQRARYTVEYNMDALLRVNLKDRMAVYAQAVQNGIYTRNFCRQLENESPIDGGDGLTVQSNLLPIEMLGKVQGGSSVTTQDAIAQ